MRTAMYHAKCAALLLCMLLLTSCDLLSGQTGQKGGALDFENVKEARYLNVQNAQTAVFRTEAEWDAFWNAHVDTQEGADTPPPPQINFDEHMVIGLFWGTITGCSGEVDAIQDVRAGGNEIVVRAEDWTSGATCMALVQPRQVIKIAQTDRPVTFRGEIPTN